jgi:hypothetical protein
LVLLDVKGAFLHWNMAQYSANDVPICPALGGVVRSPLWSYRLGLQNGFMPTGPRDSVGVYAALGVAKDPFTGVFSAWQTGGAGVGTIASTAVAVCTGTPSW